MLETLGKTAAAVFVDVPILAAKVSISTIITITKVSVVQLHVSAVFPSNIKALCSWRSHGTKSKILDSKGICDFSLLTYPSGVLSHSFALHYFGFCTM